MKNEINEKMFFIVEKIKYSHSKDTYNIHDNTMYDLTTEVKKLFALDTLNEDKERISYHLQEVDLSIAETPLVLTEEVKETESKSNQEEMPF